MKKTKIRRYYDIHNGVKRLLLLDGWDESGRLILRIPDGSLRLYWPYELIITYS